MEKPDIVIIPGNGGSHIETDHWYGWLRDELTNNGYNVTATDMPDPVAAHQNIWLPYIENELIKSPNTIAIGHSTGAVAIMRYLETHKLVGAILIGCNYTDLGFEDEKEAGWYDAPWQWDQIKANANWITQFASNDDPFIPMSEVEHIHTMLGSNLINLPGRGHFMTDHNSLNSTFPEIVEQIISLQ